MTTKRSLSAAEAGWNQGDDIADYSYAGDGQQYV